VTAVRSCRPGGDGAALLGPRPLRLLRSGRGRIFTCQPV